MKAGSGEGGYSKEDWKEAGSEGNYPGVDPVVDPIETNQEQKDWSQNSKTKKMYSTKDEINYIKIAGKMNLIILICGVFSAFFLIYVLWKVIKVTKCANRRTNLLFTFIVLTVVADLVKRIVINVENNEKLRIR